MGDNTMGYYPSYLIEDSCFQLYNGIWHWIWNGNWQKIQKLKGCNADGASGSEVGLFVLDAIPTVRSPKVATEKEEQECFFHIATINCLWTLVFAPCFFFSPLGAFFL